MNNDLGFGGWTFLVYVIVCLLAIACGVFLEWRKKKYVAKLRERHDELQAKWDNRKMLHREEYEELLDLKDELEEIEEAQHGRRQ